MHIPLEASEVHGIYDEDVKDAPTFRRIAQSLYLYLEDCDLGGYNIVKFDVPVLVREFQRAGLQFEIKQRRIVDAYYLYCKMEPRTLKAAYKTFCGKNLDDAHSAEADTLATVEVFEAELKKYAAWTSEELPEDVEFSEDLDVIHNLCNPKIQDAVDPDGRFRWKEGEVVVAFGRNAGQKLKTIAVENPDFLRWILKADFSQEVKKIASDALKGYFRKSSEPMNSDFKHLLKLLDDDNEQAASLAMAELIQNDDPRLERVLRSLQETPDAKLRRRIHQMQSALIKRRNRKTMADSLRKGEYSLLEGIVRLHLLWFDNDTRAEVLQQWQDFLQDSSVLQGCRIEKLFAFLGEKIRCVGFSKDDLNADTICLGTILEDGAAIDFMCCILAKLLAEAWHTRMEVVQTGGEFAVLCGGTLYYPAKQWDSIPNIHPGIHAWTTEELLTLVASTLFTCAVATDSFRYIYTIGNCLLDGTENILFLPYPYGNGK